jgi:alpha-D-ribose 1-methylphosphonate 5-triphosphate synthase subunit PhnL
MLHCGASGHAAHKRAFSLLLLAAAGCQIVLVDEPTTGMDPISRRAAWEFIRKRAAGRTIVLTTVRSAAPRLLLCSRPGTQAVCASAALSIADARPGTFKRYVSAG